MNGKLILLVDADHEIVTNDYDFSTGMRQEQRQMAVDLCRKAGIKFTPMTQDLKSLQLWNRKTRDGRTTPVTLGSLGRPFVLVRFGNDGQIVNEFSMKDLGRIVPMSGSTVKELCEIFQNGTISNEE